MRKKISFVGCFAIGCFVFLMAFTSPDNQGVKDKADPESELDSLLNASVQKLDEPAFMINSLTQATDTQAKKALLEVVYEILDMQQKLNRLSFTGTRMSLQNRIQLYPEDVTDAQRFLKNLDKYEEKVKANTSKIYQNDKKAIQEINDFLAQQRAVLLNNPLLNDKEVLVIRQKVKNSRKAMARQIGRNQNNWTTNYHVSRSGWENDICRLSNIQEKVIINSILKTENGYPLKDIDLHWDADRLLFSSIGEHNRWHIFEYFLELLIPACFLYFFKNTIIKKATYH